MNLYTRLIKITVFELTIYGLLAFQAGCAFSKNFVSIAEIKQQNSGSIIYIEGQVNNQAPFLGSSAYQIKDSTGTIWVMPKQSIPKIGQTIIIEGKVQYQNINVDNIEMGEFYILEIQQIEDRAILPTQPSTNNSSATKPSETTKPIETTKLPEIDRPSDLTKPPFPNKPSVNKIPQTKPTTKKTVDDLFLPHKRNFKFN
jgi:hypothetical protein